MHLMHCMIFCWLQSEYAGVETLRTRLDDAVNTMIRRDDSEEEGVYLPPCVEGYIYFSS